MQMLHPKYECQTHIWMFNSNEIAQISPPDAIEVAHLNDLSKSKWQYIYFNLKKAVAIRAVMSKCNYAGLHLHRIENGPFSKP